MQFLITTVNTQLPRKLIKESGRDQQETADSPLLFVTADVPVIFNQILYLCNHLLQ